MTTTELKQKLHDSIDILPEKKLIAIYTMMEDEIEQAQNYWEDEEFVAKLEHRDREMKA
jgi:hypothetical protein